MTDFDVDALLDGAASTGTKTKKSDTPTWELGNKDHQEIASRWVAANKAIDANEAIKSAAEAELVPLVRAFHAKAITGTAKDVPAAVKVVAPAGNFMVDIAKNQYKKVPLTDKPKLAAIFDPIAPGAAVVDGATTPVTDRLFAKVTEIKLTPEALADKEIITNLIKAVGKENFKKYFKVESNLQPTAAFHAARFLDPALVPKIKTAIDEGLVSPYAPSFKAKAT